MISTRTKDSTTKTSTAYYFSDLTWKYTVRAMGAHAGEPMGKTVGMTVGISIIIPAGMYQVLHDVGTCKRRTYDMRG